MIVIFCITYIIAIFGLIFYPDIILDQGGVGAEPLTLGYACGFYLFVGGILFLRHYRDNPIIGPIYNVVKLFFIVLFATLMYGFIKQKFKEEYKEWTGKK
jgi:hypothetical protein